MKSVVTVGSRRFKKEIVKFAKDLQSLGVLVFAPYLHEGKEEWQSLSEQYKKFVLLGLTHDHFYKIKMADVVFVYNKDGYSGVSTTLEIGCAMALGKVIYSLCEDTEEGCRNILFRENILTPAELVNKLK
ncbi:MAG: hypothetical protein WCG48_04025 [Candidatus Berkelbacteria bacterium]